MSAEIRQGDCLELLREMPAGCVQTVITSPPYWGLRDYGTAEWEGGDAGCEHQISASTLGGGTNKAHNGSFTANYKEACPCGARRIDSQLGLEPTPDLYVQNLVEVFREVRRVLRDDGTVWLNLGDSYAGSMKGINADGTAVAGPKQATNNGSVGIYNERPPTAESIGLKPKDLVGIPWSVVKALQQPYYAGRIKAEKDRAWLAATIDGEGTICGFRHQRKDDGRIRTGVHTTITNSSEALLDEAHRIWPASRSEHVKPGEGHLGDRETWRWIAHGVEDKALLMCELYPHLIVKRQQALLAYNLLMFQTDAKRLGRSVVGDEVRAKRDRLTECLSAANGGREFDVPNWCVEPPSLYEAGWFLRSDVIWAKPNPMPESVRDRPTRSHEYIFLLSKSSKYFFDQEAVREPLADSERETDPYESEPRKNGRIKGNIGVPGGYLRPEAGRRNIRSVWQIATQPYKEAHFATFPEKLIEPCVLAGSAEGDLVLDPFAGSGTVGVVALRHGRSFIGLELNPSYCQMAHDRIKWDAPLLNEVSGGS